MKKLATLLASALVAGLLMVGVTAAPASADDGVCAGQGNATVAAPGLTYPLMGPKQTLPFAFGGTFCVVVTPLGGTKTLTALGDVNGYCGLSSGFGTAYGFDPHDFAFIDIGGVLVVTGELVGVAVAVPNLFWGASCLTGARDFILVGAVLKIDDALPYFCPFPPTTVPPTICGL